MVTIKCLSEATVNTTMIDKPFVKNTQNTTDDPSRGRKGESIEFQIFRFSNLDI